MDEGGGPAPVIAPPPASPDILPHFPPNMTPRPEQVNAIQLIQKQFNLGKKIVAFQGPVGSGKSAVALAVARHARHIGESAYLITVQKILMDQYSQDFKPPEIEAMKGRSNYPCSFDKDDSRDASKGYCRRVAKTALIPECLRFGTMEQAQKFELPPNAHSCDYWAQMAKSMASKITLFNFHSFLFQQRLGRFGARDLMILDECHNIESVLLQFVEVVLSDKILQKIDIQLDLRIKTAEDLIAWLDRERIVERIMGVLGENSGKEGCAENLTPGETDRLRSLLDRIADLQRLSHLTEWVIDVTEEIDEDDPNDKTRKLRARPVFIGLFAKELLFSKAKRTMAMSATILNPKIWAKNLGISQLDLGYVETPCTFPVKNRPIFCDYAGDMSWKNFENTLPKLYATITRLLDNHQDQRGIIHGHSERLCRLILENVRSPRFVHLNMFPYRDKTELLKKHLGKPDSVIVASGFHEGVDLVGDLARFQIVAKIPWPSTEDRLVKARMLVDPTYLAYQAALKLIQSCGRAVRNSEDWAATYIVDAGFEKFQSRCGWLFPKWFSEAIQKPSRYTNNS